MGDCMFYSVGEMSEILGITERSVYRSGKKIPGYIRISGRIYFRKETFLKATLGANEPKERVAPVNDRHNLI